MKNLNIIKDFIKQYEIIIASAGVICVVILMSYVFIKPNLEKASYISSRENELKARLNNLKAKNEILNHVDLSQYKDNFSKLSIVLPDNKDYVSLFNTFDSLEEKSGISITKTSFQLGIVSTPSAKLLKDSGVALTLPLIFGVTGSISDIQNFLSLLKDLTGRLITLEKIDFGFKDNGSINMTLVGQAYFYPYPATIGSINSPLSKLNPRQEELFSLLSQLPPLPVEETNVSGIQLGKKNLFQ